jgi:toxin CcdB
MARFDVYKELSHYGLVLDVQADLLSDLHTRAVVPLALCSVAARETFPRLHPLLRLNGQGYMMITPNIAALHVNELSGPIGNLEDQRGAIIDAIDFLLQGF